MLVAHLDAEGWSVARVARLLEVHTSTVTEDKVAVRRRRGVVLAGSDGPELAAQIDARFERLREKHARIASSADNSLADVLKLLRNPLPEPGETKESRRVFQDAIAVRDAAVREATVLRLQASSSYREMRALEESRVRLFQSLGIVRKEPDVLLVAAEVRSEREGVLRLVIAAFEGLPVEESIKHLFRERIAAAARIEGGS